MSKESKKTKEETKEIEYTKKCFICNREEDDDGRCKCVNEDAWGINV